MKLALSYRKLFCLAFQHLQYFVNLCFVGITSRTEYLKEDITEEELLNFIEKLNKDDAVDGILVQLPVPQHISERAVCNTIHPDKDVDGFHNDNVGKLCLNMDTFVPATALGVLELLKR